MIYQTYARIHLENIRFNIEGIRHAVGPQRKILLAVKANAYGHGSVEVSRLAESMGVEWLGVALVREGLALRQAGIRLPVLKFSPAFSEDMEDAARANIALTVCDRENIEALQQSCQRAHLQAKVHLKVDTGMGRIGASPAETPELAAFIENKCPNLVLEGLYTHLPVSDAGDTAYTRDQVNRFMSIVDDVHAAIGRRVSLVHCANSGAVLGYPGAWLDMVRPGIMIYGYHPGPETPHTIPLRPGMSFFTRVSVLKQVSAGTSIGYGRTWFAPQDTWIATIPVGYADGFNRLFSNRGRVLIGGQFYPVVGRVCMDQSMFDLGAQTSIRVGDDVVLIGGSGGQEITADDWARMLGTISYEVLGQVNARVPRVYD